MGASASHVPSTFNSLNATLGGRLQSVVPFARPCFRLASQDTHGHLDSAECTEVIQTYDQRDVLPSIFGAYLNTAWTVCQATGEQCLLDNSNPNNSLAFLPPSTCAQGNLPHYYIDVRDAGDAIAVFEFSRQTGVPLSIKNTGHDYAGRSTAPGSLALWVHNLQGISFDKLFVPTDCKQAGVPAVTFGTGVTLGTLYEFADANNITILGGADSSIAGGGGYVLGGGHSAFSNALGLAVDQVLEFEIVTPDGRHRFANRCSHPDLFFALRGGGVGTFGVVLRVTLKALPRLSFPVVRTAFNGIPSVEEQTEYVEFLIDHAVQLASKGWGGYIEPGLGLTFVNPLVGVDEAAETMEDLKQLVTTKLNGTFILQQETSYLSFYNEFVRPTTLPNDASSALASRLIPASVFESAPKRQDLLRAVVTAAKKHTITFLFAVAPYFFKGDNNTSLNPLWRTSIWHVIYIDYWSFNTTVSARNQIYHDLQSSAAVLREIAPKSAVYQNEASIFEPNFEDAFWGSNYNTLVTTKRKYDPYGLLDCWKCVDWKGPSHSRYRCQPR